MKYFLFPKIPYSINKFRLSFFLYLWRKNEILPKFLMFLIYILFFQFKKTSAFHFLRFVDQIHPIVNFQNVQIAPHLLGLVGAEEYHKWPFSVTCLNKLGLWPLGWGKAKNLTHYNSINLSVNKNVSFSLVRYSKYEGPIIQKRGSGSMGWEAWWIS